MTNQPAFTIFIVEDDEWYGKMLEHHLTMNPDFKVVKCPDGNTLLNKLNTRPDVVTLDYRLPDIDGGEILKRIKRFDEEIEVIIVSEQDSIETAVDLLKEGAFDYIVKDKDIGNRLLNTVNHIRKNKGLKTQISQLQKEVEKKYSFENSIIGNSIAIKQVFELIDKAIKTNITVTITGETGTGKELVAKAIHYNSERRKKPFLAVNVAAFPKDLVESELFGHEKGAFTGASQRRIGKFEESDGGTLFLDEIAEMDMNVQVKLLRALQEREIVRIGSNETVKFDSRIIVATHQNLQNEIKKGNFREDLYYRLFGLPVELPPLRERDNDILIIAKHFINAFCKENKLPEKELSNEAQKKLLSYSYPGNVRELKSVVELAVVMSNNEAIDAGDILFTGENVLAEIINEEMTLKEYTHRIINTYLKKHNNSVKIVAEKLDIGQATIYRMLKENTQDN